MLDSITSSPDFYKHIGTAVLLLTLLNVLEVLFLIYNKRRVELSERRRTELKRLASTALITATNPADLLPPPACEDDFAAYSEAVSSVLESFEGEISERARVLITQLGIDEHYRRLARHRVWYKRGNAIDILAAFRLKNNREFFLAVFRSETSNEVKYRILYGLSRLTRGHEDIAELARLLSTLPYLTSKYTEDIFYNIISALKAAGREEEFGRFMDEALKDSGVLLLVKRDFINACYAAACDKGRGLLKKYYAAYPAEPEILISCIRALARVGDFSEVPAALGHADWRVRMSALKYADVCCSTMLPEMRALLRDPNYHVRLNAALALAKSGDTGRAVLKAETAGGDKFAAQAAAYALSQEAR